MVVILTNQTQQSIFINSLGITLNGGDQITVEPVDYNRLSSDDELITLINNGSIAVADEYGTLKPYLAIQYIKLKCVRKHYPCILIPTLMDISNLPLYLEPQSNSVYFFTGNTESPKVYLGDALTYMIAHQYLFYNLSDVTIDVHCYTGEKLLSLAPLHCTTITLYQNDTSKGQWIFTDSTFSVG